MQKSKIFKVVGTILAVILGTMGTLICFSIAWMFRTWSNLTVDEMVYHLTAPLEGTNDGLIQGYLNECAVPTILMFIILLILFITLRKRKAYAVVIIATIILSILASCVAIFSAWKRLDVGNYVSGQSKYSTFIDDNYINPSEVDITFPENKRNLIYIFLESMETTYADISNGGGFRKNYIPELTELAEENEDFSGENNKLNGAYSLPGTTWTMGAMFGHTSGIPLNISISANYMDTQETFFASTITLGDILQREGYSQTLLIGSEAEFGGRKLYFTEHGEYDMMDYNQALDTGLIPEDYCVWWGYEDQKLFSFAKDKLQELDEGQEPFNLTMLTADTHFEDGYPCELCPDTFGDNSYASVMACSSRQVSEFIRWIQEQDFYENTTVVVVGDHPTMDSDFCKNISKDYERRVYANYINAVVEPVTETKRTYTTLDFFPTTLASMGAKIEGERLGLGTNLFSEKPTLAERFAVKELGRKVSGKSKLMEELADIDLNKEELVARLEADEQTQITAVVTAGQYDYINGALPVEVLDVNGVDTATQSLSLAVWTDAEQADLQWVPLELGEDGSYHARINVPGFGYKTGEYQIQAYADTYMIGQTVGIVN